MPLETTMQNPTLDRRPHVLVVDDEMPIRRALWFILKNEFEVTALENGNKAIEMIRKNKDIAVVSLDLNMPGKSGIETLEEIKQLSPITEVLLVTAYSDVDTAKKALKLGAYEYIEKPIEKEAYCEAVRKGVQRHTKLLASEHAQKQLEIVKAQLVHTEKMSAIGNLLAGVVHEINNPLTGIIGYSELLLLKQSSPENITKYIQNIQEMALLCQNVVKKLLTFSRKHEPNKAYIEVTQLLANTLDLVQQKIKSSNIDVIKQFAENMPGTIADSHQIQQVFLNIITNAVQAMEKQTQTRTLTITTEFDAKKMRISFRDTGPGIAKENLQKIFEPFFTTKEIGKGTGLGLSICYEIAQEHGGDIYISSELERGACFVIELPILSELDAPKMALPERKKQKKRGGQKILVIDKNQWGYGLLGNMVSALNHHVVVVEDALTAQQELNDENYDVIISDFAMPQFNGRQLWEYLNRTKPALLSRIIFVTDGMLPDENKHFLKENRILYVAKPYKLDDIQTAIQKIEASST